MHNKPDNLKKKSVVILSAKCLQNKHFKDLASASNILCLCYVSTKIITSYKHLLHIIKSIE